MNAVLNDVGEVPDDYEILDATALGSGWDSSGIRCLRTCLEGTSGGYLAQPPACYGAALVREERQRMGSKGGSDPWRIGTVPAERA